MEESRLDTTHTAEMIKAVALRLGREVKVYVSPAAIPCDDTTASPRPSQGEEPEDFYEFTAADYAALQASKKEEVFLKTRKIRDQEQAARRAQRTKATIRVLFPDCFVLEATFKSSETISVLLELIQKAIVRPELPFYIYTTPPKRPVKNLQQTMIDASFTPGAIVYFTYDSSKGVEFPKEGPFLRPEIQELRDLHNLATPGDNALNALQQGQPMEAVKPPEAPAKRAPAGTSKPKWMKL